MSQLTKPPEPKIGQFNKPRISPVFHGVVAWAVSNALFMIISMAFPYGYFQIDSNRLTGYSHLSVIPCTVYFVFGVFLGNNSPKENIFKLSFLFEGWTILIPILLVILNGGMYFGELGELIGISILFLPLLILVFIFSTIGIGIGQYRFERKLIFLAKQNDPESQFQIGLNYHLGKGKRIDYKKAFEWYKKASDLGHPLATNNLGIFYESGKEVPQDYSEAVKYYEKAIQRGSLEAFLNLGTLLENGKGIAQDFPKAIELYQIAAGKGLREAMLRLGKLYLEGREELSNWKEAYKWFKLAETETIIPCSKEVPSEARVRLKDLEGKLSIEERNQGHEVYERWRLEHDSLYPKNRKAISG